MWTVWEFEPRFDESITGLSLPQPPASTAITRPPDAAPSLIGLPTPMGDAFPAIGALTPRRVELLHPVVERAAAAGTLVVMGSTDQATAQTHVSAQLFADACTVIPGGVNSPVRAFTAVGGTPRFITEAHGCRLTDADGNHYVDLVCSWGPMILGHAHPAVVDAVAAAAANGLSFGAPTPAETDLAAEIITRVAPVERIRLVNSGTEATMSAVRLARGYTGRAKIIKFSGCYHGHVDALLADAGSGVATLGLPSSPGSPAPRRPTPSCCPTTTSTPSGRVLRGTASRSPR
ncbi:hypothetical protein NIIDMKKI_65700 [Mycobacterium kansasii]|uniref:Aminotransferase class-III family protein n=2 Tax=Mycobacterium kansasii TaxID=1768 RepID=A0A7G1ILT0_MYCKA|nr:hypothetical protein NIIDMKKI_65700 [Mycobacterium kansasii]